MIMDGLKSIVRVKSWLHSLVWSLRVGGGTPVPDLSIEVDDLDVALYRIKAEKIKIEYGPVLKL